MNFESTLKYGVVYQGSMVTADEILKALQQMKNNKAPREDFITCVGNFNFTGSTSK